MVDFFRELQRMGREYQLLLKVALSSFFWKLMRDGTVSKCDALLRGRLTLLA